MEAQPNRLIDETSPYLAQHALNPVQWQPWDARALAEARAAGKPILLSIGYSACHWCHVMAHESFEDADTAALMNERFVNIKVDREERPDLDKIYQTTYQLMNRRAGGWPLTVFLSPNDLAPFFSGTYFPREPRHGMAGFSTVLDRVADYFDAHKDEIESHGASLNETLSRLHQHESARSVEPDQSTLDKALDALDSHYDAAHGGFGGAPKFPRPNALELMLGGPRRMRDKALDTLAHMANGGLFDQIGGGFYRYSVDAGWRIPHFEKMLYDNGALVGLYAVAARLTGEARFKTVAAMTAEWMMDVMQGEAGGYRASLDADSEGEEGKYYLWSVNEARALLSPGEFALAEQCFGLGGPPNFEGRWHLAFTAGDSDDIDVGALDAVRRKLARARDERVPPARDDKILAAWNGLAIAGMARAGRLLDERNLIDSATRAVDFVRARMWEGGRLRASFKDGRARFNGYLDDYAFMAHACLQLLQARWRTSDLEFARDLVETMLEHFEDSDKGGFWFTSDDHEHLLDRPKTFADESTASGNGAAARALVELGHLLGEIRYLDAAARTFKAGTAALGEHPDAMCGLLVALRAELDLPPQIILRGEPAVLMAWRDAIEADFDVRRRVYAIPHDANDLPGLLGACESRADGVAYLCEGTECSEPLASLGAVLERLEGGDEFRSFPSGERR
jgi:uncharacterized protein YyaL (SSP411 family)